MPIRYEPDYGAHIDHVTGEGEVTYADCVKLIEQQGADVKRRLHELNDYRGVDLQLDARQAETLARLNVQLYAEVHDIRFAVVVDPGLGVGMSRVFEAYLNDSVEFRVFTDYAAARDWVLEAAVAESE